MKLSPRVSREIIERELESNFRSDMNTPEFDEILEQDKNFMATYTSFIRFNIIKSKKVQLLDEDTFFDVRHILLQYSTISYQNFKSMRTLVPEKALRFFTAKVFLMFPKDEKGCIEKGLFLKYD
jgi:hypothetical protein